MKKYICFMLAIVMLMSLCGCGGNSEEEVRGNITESQDQSQQQEQEQEQNQEKEQEQNQEQEQIEEKEPEFSLGKTEDNIYRNDFLGITCTLPAQWVFYTDEQILQLNNIVGEVVDEDVAKQLEKATIIYDMNATDQAAGNSVNINLEKFSTVQILALDVKQALEGQIDAIKSAYQNMGYTDIAVNYQKVTVDGKEFDGLKLSAKIQDLILYMVIFSFKKGNYLANVTVGTLLTDQTDTVLGYFTVQ